MSRFEQLSHEEIAGRAGISVSTVKKHIHKALSILREEFRGDPFDLMLVGIVIFLR